MKSEFLLNKDGTRKIMYHGTNHEFDYFASFSHFGTKKAAESIGVQLSRNPKIIPVYLKIKNPFIIPDFGTYENMDFRQVLLNHLLIKEIPKDLKKKIPILQKHNVLCAVAGYDVHEQIIDNLRKDKESFVNKAITYVFSAEYEISKANFINYFRSCGYDGFAYTNTVEDPGHTSYMPFYASQVHRLDIDLPPINTGNTSENDIMSQISKLGRGNGLNYYDVPDQNTYQHLLMNGLYYKKSK